METYLIHDDAIFNGVLDIDDTYNALNIDDTHNALNIDDTHNALNIDDTHNALNIDDTHNALNIDDTHNALNIDDAHNSSFGVIRTRLHYFANVLTYDYCQNLAQIFRDANICKSQ